MAYGFTSVTATAARLKLVALPTHPLAPGLRLRVAVTIDGGSERVVDFATLGRNDIWRENVLRNTAIGTIPLQMLPAGRHSLALTALDPGVVIDRIQIELDGARPLYGTPHPPVE